MNVCPANDGDRVLVACPGHTQAVVFSGHFESRSFYLMTLVFRKRRVRCEYFVNSKSGVGFGYVVGGDRDAFAGVRDEVEVTVVD
jgi:hypothetical protein